MPKVKRAGSGASTRRRANRRSAAVSAPRRLRNWADAQLRSARYRLANAARLGALALACILTLSTVLMIATGRAQDVRLALVAEAQTRLADAGFAVDVIDVAGAGRLDADEIAAASGVLAGESIFAVNPDQVRVRVEALPPVRKASVARLWPNRVSILVEMREAYALWQMDGALHVIDQDGAVMAQADMSNPPNLPLVVDTGANTAAPEIVEALRRHPIISERVVGAIRVGERRWNLRLKSGADVRLPEGDVAASLAILANLQAERGILRLAAESFDLRGEGDLVVRALPDRDTVGRERDA
ncbi:cell division protein FtsQ/DivIB [Maricaulis sp. D1M11]|uniref:cell division protein FtsQ/DivIB n=1 Tax=Maricaulis sp. D1M11 TaxID=3076117 RepID=UPI0039B664D4